MNVVLFLLWLGIINEAAVLNMKKDMLDEQKADSVLSKEKSTDLSTISDEVEAIKDRIKTTVKAEAVTEPVKQIRVLLMDSEYESYYHPQVNVQYDGKEEVYTMESEMLNNGAVIIECDGEGIAISSIQRQQGTPVYQGTIEIKKTEEGLLLVNELPVERYLETVVPSEMPVTYEMEALKAQAVCARTYAYKQMEKESLKSFGADVDDSVNFQVYGNISAHERTSEAVIATEGQVLYQGDELIEAYYFSTSSGRTSTNEVWGEKETAAYLKSVECSFDADEKWSRWEVEIPWEKLQDQLNNKGMAGAVLLNLQANRKSESGVIVEMTAVTDCGNIVLNGEYEIREFLTPEECGIMGNDGSYMMGGRLLPSACFDMDIDPGNCVKITGRGYGHGVGMSQNGADEMAKEGFSYDEILYYFFKDVKIGSKNS